MTPSKRVLLFDIDDTLIDTKSMNKNILKYLFNPKKFRDLVFPDVLKSLDILKINNDIGIYSKGFKLIQKLKLELVGVKKYFNNNLIFTSHTKFHTIPDDILKLAGRKIVFIDNDPRIIKVAKRAGFKYVIINRSKKDFKANTVKSLNDLVKYL